MRNLMPVLISAFFVLFFSCEPAVEHAGEFSLLPLPQVVEFLGPSSIYPDELKKFRLADGIKQPLPPEYLKDLQETYRVSGLQIIFRKDKTIETPKEGYILDISRKNVTILSNKKPGLFYGYMTLLQLMDAARDQGIPLPRCHIEDAPKMSYRAIHLDMKHHMEKTEYYYQLMDQLARYKINAVIAEVEDKLGYVRQPEVASADALSMEEWKKLSDYADARNIEISPLVQGLGHASYILKHDDYKYLRDDPESDWAFNPLLPETYKVQFDLYLDALEAMPYGGYLHVGGDEVHTTGRGSGKSELELQMIWLNKVCMFADEQGRTPIFWDDMPIKYAGLYDPMFNEDYTREEVDSMWKENEHILLNYLEMFPKNCIYMRWNYSHPKAEGNIKAMEWFSEHDLDVMGATAGQTRWKLMPQNESNIENIRSFANISIEKEIDGLLLTLWDDDSPHFELYMRGIVAFAEYCWAGDKRSGEEIKEVYRQREYGVALGDEEYGFVDRLEPAVQWWNDALLNSDSRNKLRSMGKYAEVAVIELPFSGKRGEWSKKYEKKIEAAASILNTCDYIGATIASMKSQATRNLYRLQVYEQVNNLVRFSAHALLALHDYDTALNEELTREAFAAIQLLPLEFKNLRAELELVYSRTRILNKPRGYLLDQDHHLHMANQSINFDWQFWAEIYFLEKLEKQINNL